MFKTTFLDLHIIIIKYVCQTSWRFILSVIAFGFTLLQMYHPYEKRTIRVCANQALRIGLHIYMNWIVHIWILKSALYTAYARVNKKHSSYRLSSLPYVTAVRWFYGLPYKKLSRKNISLFPINRYGEKEWLWTKRFSCVCFNKLSQIVYRL